MTRLNSYLDEAEEKEKDKNGTKEWWDALSGEEQNDWLKKYPDGGAAKNVQNNIWVQKSPDDIDGEEPPEPPEPTPNPLEDVDFDSLSDKELEDVMNNLSPEDRQGVDAERTNLDKRQEKLHSKFGRLLATQDELEELDKERDEKEEEERKKEKKEMEEGGEDEKDYISETAAVKKTVKTKSSNDIHDQLVQQLKDNGFEFKKSRSGGKWEHPTSGKIAKIVNNKIEYIEGDEQSVKKKGKKVEQKAQIIPLSPRQKKALAKRLHDDEEKVRKETEKEEKRKQEKSMKGGKEEAAPKEVLPQRSNEKSSKLWKTDNEYSIKNILKKNEKYNGKDISAPGKPFKFSSDFYYSGKYPKKYVQVVEAMMNTRIANKDGTEPPISYFMTGGGKGIIQSQAGEILTMMAVTMNDKEFYAFYHHMKNHMDNTRESKDEKYVVNRSWLDATKKQRDAIHKSVRDRYGVKDASDVIVSSCWDVKDEVETLGMDDYDKNKGYSTDIYLKVENKKGKQFFDQWSLKKDSKVFLLNSGIGILSDWDKNLPEDARLDIYGQKQKEILRNISFGKGTSEKDIIKYFTDTKNRDLPGVKEVNEILKAKKLKIEDVFDVTNRNKAKVVKYMHEALAETGNKNSIKVLKDLKDHEKKTISAAVREITTNPIIKKHMLELVREKLPLKDLMYGVEKMAVGGTAVDKKVMENIFGTGDWNKVKEKLKPYTDPPPPYVGYVAETSGKPIRIAIINIREEAPGYSATIKLEMALDKEFAKRLDESNKSLFGDSVDLGFISNLGKYLIESELIEDD